MGLADYNKTVFLPDRGETRPDACSSIMLNGGGHFGPFVDIGDYYTIPPRTEADLSLHEKLELAEMKLVATAPATKAIQMSSSAISRYVEMTSDKCLAKTRSAQKKDMSIIV